MSPQCSTKRSAAPGSFPVFSVISVITEISEQTEGKSRGPGGLSENPWAARGYAMAPMGDQPRQKPSRAGGARPWPKPRPGGQGFMQHQHLADRLGGETAKSLMFRPATPRKTVNVARTLR